MISSQLRYAAISLSITLILASTACGLNKAPEAQVVRDVQAIQGEAKPGVNGPTATVTVSMTLDKATLLGQEFLYGADLQYSSIYDKSYDLFTQSLAIGHIPAKFRIAGSELQLVADNKRLSPSDVNHPELLLTRFKILAETLTTLTVSNLDSRTFLAEVFKGTHSSTEGRITANNGSPSLDLWVRSLNTEAARENYILQETSIVDQDGNIGEFMESIFPRAKLATGSSFKKFKMDPDSPVGADEGPVARFRMLGSETVYEGEDKVAYAAHFDISDGKTIDWYATPNIPEEYLETVKQGVEGWNRYYRGYQGIARDVLQFKGRLPEGIKLGDPRYNVVAWDARTVAGAAYETQATDPSTGRQSHSVIYLPAAWVQIGKDYWTNGRYSDPRETNRAPEMRYGKINCSRDLRTEAAMLFSGAVDPADVAKFGRELLRQTLFHEVGHSLGLGHNFKGSLSYDMSLPESERIFSSSIMDYNIFDIERQAFNDLTSSNGPQLEYDRQALSAIYNESKDIAADAKVMPACNDAEADSEAGGVDPLCIRYDVEKDPTLAILTGFKRINNETVAGDRTLSDAIKKVPSLALDAQSLSTVADADALKLQTQALAAGLKAALRYSYTNDRHGPLRTVRNNLKALHQFADDVLPAGYDAKAMRERAFKGAQDVLSIQALPSFLAGVVDGMLVQAEAKLRSTPFVHGLAAADADAAIAEAKTSVKKVLTSFVADSKVGLPKLRQAILVAMTRSPAVPFYFGTVDQAQIDYETAIVSLLGDAAKGKFSDSVAGKRTTTERKAALASLLTFKGRRQGDQALEGVKTQLQEERVTASDNDTREAIEAMLTLL